MNQWGKRADMIVHGVDPFNAEAPAAALIGQRVTPVDAFYSRNHGSIPSIDPAAWRLSVDGMVGTPLELSLADLRAGFQVRTVTATLQCAGNRRRELVAVRDIPGEDPWGPGAISTAQWTGVRLADVLAMAGCDPAAHHVAFDAPDVSQLAEPVQSYGGSIAMSKAMAGEVVLAWGMNGDALPPAHGGPVRVVVPGYIGARSVKWVQRITVQSGPSANYFQAVAYRVLPADAAPESARPGHGISLTQVALNCAILTPADGGTLPAGPVEIQGYAVTGDDRAVARVDVSVDGGSSWQQAELDDSDEWTWRLWRTTVTIRPHTVDILARAWDTTATVQPELPEQVWNPKGYVNNSWPRVRVHCRG